jgi:3-methyladenine DNA glycosylase Mpg
LWIELGDRLAPRQISRGPRVGLGRTPEPWLSKPWRFWVKDSPFVSR